MVIKSIAMQDNHKCYTFCMAIIAKADKPEGNIHKINNFLTVIVIALGIYLIISPIMPQLLYWLKNLNGQIDDTIPYSSSQQGEEKDPNLPEENRLVIPQMDLDGEIFEGKYAGTLSKGIWRRPNTSEPDKGGNTVLVGHRFTYSSPAIFYHLDKLNKDDEFALIWNQQLYNYRVREIRVVEPEAVEIENNTDEPILTLYTCTPMWTAEKRLVVVADLIERTP